MLCYSRHALNGANRVSINPGGNYLGLVGAIKFVHDVNILLSLTKRNGLTNNHQTLTMVFLKVDNVKGKVAKASDGGSKW